MANILPLQLLEVESDGCHLMCKASVEGKEINMLIDTGASRTVFDSVSIKSILGTDLKSLQSNERLSAGIGTTNLESLFLNIKTLKIGSIRIKNYQAVLIDLDQVNNMYTSLGLPAIEGVLGGDLLISLGAIIDYRKMTLKLRKPQKQLT
jgi:clan AA aspartic protease (TIGR02281 family)